MDSENTWDCFDLETLRPYRISRPWYWCSASVAACELAGPQYLQLASSIVLTRAGRQQKPI
ncbi:hypothetical protein AURDEDRAFT_141855 [Auricularia subglabra TFB-10046 SS5]|nr:hypothetical protein AURDEDRAFT_141855 [Auricularia subglabra TFB-10046 SS5]